MYKVIIVDDEPIIVEGLKLGIDGQIGIVKLLVQPAMD